MKNRPLIHSRIDISGHKFSRLTAMHPLRTVPKKGTIWSCICDCGSLLEVDIGKLRSGNTKSCGCLKIEMIGRRRRTHGQSKKAGSLYNTWQQMKLRCNDTKNPSYKYYGARGIYVCARWSSFELFIKDVGVRPPGFTLDRIDNEGPYAPWNCRWASREQQHSNKRNNRLVCYRGETIALTELCRRENAPVRPSVVAYRISHGWDLERALRSAPRSFRITYGELAK